MTNEQTRDVNGTLIRGADGALYFIPDADLAGYRVPEENAAEVREVLDDGNEVRGFSTPLLSPGVSVLPAFGGVLGSKGSWDEKTIVQASGLSGVR